MMLAPLLLLGQTPDFATDPRLDRAVAMNESVAPLSKVVEDFSKATGVSLYVESHIREDLVVLVTRSRPARESMEKLAKHFGWRWVPASNGGYRVEPTEEFMRKARGGQPLEMLPQLQQARTYAQALLPKLERLTPAQVKQAKANFRMDDEDEKGSKVDAEKQREFGFFTNPLSLPVCRLFASLSDDQMMATIDRRMVVSTDPGTLAFGMSDRLRSDSWQGVRAFAAQMAEDYRAAPDDNAEPFDAAKATQIRYEIRDGLTVNVTILGPKRSILLRTNISFRQPIPGTKFTLPPNISAEIGRNKSPAKPGAELREPLRPYAEVLAKVGKKIDVDVVGDAYDTYLGLTQDDESDPQRWANRCAMTAEGGWLTCRARRWPTLRSRTIPRSVWNRLEGRRPRELTLNERATLSTLLDLSQSRSPLLLWGREDYTFYRFWAAVPNAMRERLFRGQSIPLASLPAEVHGYLYDSSVSGQFSFAGILDSSIFDEPELNESSDLNTDQSADQDYADLYPRWIAPNASLTLKSAEIPGIFVEEFGEVIGPSLLAEILTAEITEQDIKEVGKIRVASATGMAFRFDLAPGVRVNRQETDNLVGKEVPFDPKSWPDDLQKRIAAAKERAKQRGDDDGGRTVPPPR